MSPERSVLSSFEEKILPIRLVVFDVDGTLTDGSLWLGSAQNEEIKVFYTPDGAGLKFLMLAGLEVALITGRRSGAVDRRAAELGIPAANVIQGIDAKGAALMDLQARLGLTLAQTAAMGDDLPDLAMFRHAGLRLAVESGLPEVRAAADWVSKRPGGRGAAREAAELILKGQGHWPAIVAAFQD